jgi:hypothetical protein
MLTSGVILRGGFKCVLRLGYQSACLRARNTLLKAADRSSGDLSNYQMATGYHCRLEKR